MMVTHFEFHYHYNKTWIYHYKPESRHQSMVWKHFMPPVKKKFRYQPTVERVLLTVFRDMQEPLLEHYQERSVTVSSAHYSEVLYDSLKLANRSEHEDVLLHGSGCLHTAAHTILTLQQLCFQIL
jgi:hypothetical protein